MINIPERNADEKKTSPLDKFGCGRNIFVGGSMKKVKKSQLEKIRKVYEQIGIKPVDYPTYVDPYSFSTQFKKVSLYRSDHLIFSSSSSTQENK